MSVDGATVDTPAPPEPAREGDVLLRTRGLKKHFPVKQGLLRRTSGYLQAVDGVDLDVRRGETVGCSSRPRARSRSTASTSSSSAPAP